MSSKSPAPAPAPLRQSPRRETLLALHCSGSSARQWDGLAAALPSRFELVAPELLGYAGAPCWPLGRPLSLDDEVDALAPWLDACADGVHLVGHSYGAAVALQIALRRRVRVLSLTLYEPVRFALLFANARTAAAAASIVSFGHRVGSAVLQGRQRDAAADFIDYWCGAGSWAALRESRQQAVAERMPKVRAEFEALFADGMPHAAYPRLTMPVRLIGGALSPLPARLVLEQLAALLPQAELEVCAGLGHMGAISHPQVIAAALDRPPVGRGGPTPPRAPSPRGDTRQARPPAADDLRAEMACAAG